MKVLLKGQHFVILLTFSQIIEKKSLINSVPWYRVSSGEAITAEPISVTKPCTQISILYAFLKCFFNKNENFSVQTVQSDEN